jgi:hypothetical protein
MDETLTSLPAVRGHWLAAPVGATGADRFFNDFTIPSRAEARRTCGPSAKRGRGSRRGRGQPDGLRSANPLGRTMGFMAKLLSECVLRREVGAGRWRNVNR